MTEGAYSLEDADLPCRTPEKFETWKCQVRERVRMKCEKFTESVCTEQSSPAPEYRYLSIQAFILKIKKKENQNILL